MSPDSINVDTCHCWNGKSGRTFRQIVREVLGDLLASDPTCRGVQIHVPHGYRRTPRDDGLFHIFVWSAPISNDSSEVTRQRGLGCDGLCDSDQRHKPPEQMWKYSVSCPDKGYKYSGVGQPIRDSHGNIVAELVGNNLFIFHDVVHHGDSDEFRIFRCILEEVKTLMLFSNNWADATMEELEVSYAEVCCMPIDEEIDWQKRKIAEESDEGQSDLAPLFQAVTEQKNHLSHVEASLKLTSEELATKVESLCNIFEVAGVEVNDGNKIIIYTLPIYYLDSETEKLHEFGRYKIVLRYSQDDINYQIRLYNLDRKVHAYWESANAPHVDHDGIPCWGNYKPKVADLFNDFDLDALVIKIIKFLSSVTQSDQAGQYYYKWPTASEKIKKGWTEWKNGNLQLAE